MGVSQMAAKQIGYEPLLPLAAIAGNMPGSPPVDIRELPDEYIILADLPGVEPAAVEVTSRGDTLGITAFRRDRLNTSGVPVRLERPAGKLHRTLRLPASCDGSKITTQIRDGVLETRVPKPLDSRGGRPETRPEVSCASH
jgi:HSP20 family molecular chaperone IbpA